MTEGRLALLASPWNRIEIVGPSFACSPPAPKLLGRTHFSRFLSTPHSLA
jgi:hypothetical protein